MNKLMEYLSSNPQEAIAIAEGKAMPVMKLKPTELLQLLRELKTKKEPITKGYWG